MWYQIVVFNGWEQIFSEGNRLMGENQKKNGVVYSGDMPGKHFYSSGMVYLGF